MNRSDRPHTVPTDEVLADLEATAVRLARGAGGILAGHFGTDLTVEYKDRSGSDPVTAVDRECQEYVTQAIAAEYAGHGIIGEEDSEPRGSVAPDFVWVVDPLDGTKNFVSGLPVYACSVGVLHRGAPVAGAIYVPWAGEGRGMVLHSRSGGGAFAEGQRISVFAGDEPDVGRLATLPASFAGTFRFEKPARRRAGDLRVTGSIAYEMAMTARGSFQYSLTAAPRLWDVAAGAAIVTGAGGVVMVARRPPRARAPATSKMHWERLESFVPWRSGETTLEELRRWSEPLVLGSPGIALFVTQNLRRRVTLRQRLRGAARLLTGPRGL